MRDVNAVNGLVDFIGSDPNPDYKPWLDYPQYSIRVQKKPKYSDPDVNPNPIEFSPFPKFYLHFLQSNYTKLMFDL